MVGSVTSEFWIYMYMYNVFIIYICCIYGGVPLPVPIYVFLFFSSVKNGRCLCQAV